MTSVCSSTGIQAPGHSSSTLMTSIACWSKSFVGNDQAWGTEFTEFITRVGIRVTHILPLIGVAHNNIMPDQNAEYVIQNRCVDLDGVYLISKSIFNIISMIDYLKNVADKTVKDKEKHDADGVSKAC